MWGPVFDAWDAAGLGYIAECASSALPEVRRLSLDRVIWADNAVALARSRLQLADMLKHLAIALTAAGM
eukprot:7222942-Pyramimonas_sp.AAC.1